MAPTIPTKEPTELVAGDSWQWDKTLTVYPPSEGYALSYHLIGPQTISITAAASGSGDFFEIREAAADHAAATEGSYQLVGYATKGTDRFEVFRGAVYVRPNLATASATKSKAETELALMDTLVQALMATENDEVQIGGRRAQKKDLPQMIQVRNRLRREVWQERNPGRISPPVEVTFAAVS